MRTAAKVDANQQAVVSALEAAGASVQSLAALGRGAPDLLVGWRGADWLMEVKHPERSLNRRNPNKQQHEWHAGWKGRPVVLVLSPDDALRAIGAIADAGGTKP